MAARAVWFLASTPSHRSVLRDTTGMMPQLRALQAAPNAKLRRVVSETLEHLDTAPTPATSSSGFSLFSAYVPGGAAGASQNTAPSEHTPAKPARARPIKIAVEGISEEYWRSQVERCLISEPGVVSVTINQRTEEVVVYARGQDGLLERLLKKLERLGVEGTALDNGTGAAAPATPATKAPQTPRAPFSAVKMPEYLDEGEDEDTFFGTGVVTESAATSSLEARLAAKRKQEEEASQSRGFFGSIGAGLGLW